MINSIVVQLGVVLAQAVPNGDPKAPGPLGPKLNDLISYAKYIGLGVCVIGLIAAGGMMAISHRRGEVGMESAGSVAKVLVGVMVIVGAASLVGLFV